MSIFNRATRFWAIEPRSINRRQLPSGLSAPVMRILGDRCGNIF
ncbi:hypothetical protein QUB47_06190 [Microcoleus sp. AT9_B5]